MSSYLNFSVQTREDMKNWILTELGEPLITVELHDVQLEQAINNALEEFSKWATFEKDFFPCDLSQYTEGSGYLMPDDTVACWGIQDEMMPAGGISTLFSIPNAMWNAGVWPHFQGGVGWTQFHISMQAVDLCKIMTGKGYKFEYSPRTKYLVLYPDPIKEFRGGQTGGSSLGFIVVNRWVMRPEQQQLGESWVKRYALASAKEKLGRVRTKFSNVQLLGGGSIDTSVLQEGIEDKKTLLEELKGEQGPCEFFIG